MSCTNFSPNKKLINTPKLKKGPKGTVLPFNFFLCTTTSIIEMTAPVKNAPYNATTDNQGPSKKPITNAYFTSPNPIPRPLVSANIIKKNKKQTTPATRCEASVCGARNTI